MKLFYCSAGKLCLYISYLIFFYVLLCAWRPAQGQTPYTIQGRVLSAENQEPLVGASVLLKGSSNGTSTDKNGYFTISVAENKAHFVVSFIGFRSLDSVLLLPLRQELILSLEQDPAVLQEALVTGYQQIPKERATGSFVHVGNELVNRKVSTNVLDRLDGVASGLLFKAETQKATASNPLGRNLGIRIRGESTLGEVTQVSRDPLIVVDNFPFEGNLDNINPNDVESVSILRDAAAASIWGARAGNGVIVITTKKGSKNTPLKVEINSNVSIFNKPDLYYDRNYLSSAQYIDVEKKLFDQGYFNADLSNTTSQPPLSPVVELLNRDRSAAVTSSEVDKALADFSVSDLRSQYLRYVYRQAVNQQYSTGLKGGNQQATYALSAGFDRNLSNQIGNDYSRLTINSNSTYSLHKRLSLTVGLNYSYQKATTNNYQNNFGFMPVGGKYSSLYPYARLADDDGTPLSIVKDYRTDYIAGAQSNGYLDWQYRPLQETALADNYSKTNSLLFRTGLNYSFASWLNGEVLYQNETQRIYAYDNRSVETYYTRNMINRFTIKNADGSLTYQVPKDGILLQNNSVAISENIRGQLNFNKTLGSNHHIVALLGAEARQYQVESQTHISYGYSDAFGVSSNNLDYLTALPVNPAGTGRIPAPPGNISVNTSRFLSYFANGAYTFRGRYNISASARKDGANIFGAKTNNRFSPLWSAGLAWDISKEGFYKMAWLPYLKFRSSFGYSGNVYQGAVYVTGRYSTSSYTGARTILNLTAPNPELRWEKVGTLNVGMDFASKRNLISGSIEYYTKKGSDLIEPQLLAPSVGIYQVFANGASTRTHGIDLTLSGEIGTGAIKWNPTILVSSVTDRIEQYSIKQNSASIQNNTGRPGVIGKPLYSIYSYKWAGLDAATGDPQGFVNGEVSKNYSGIISNFNPDSLAFHGSAVPVLFGSLRNDISFKGFSLSINLTYKLGYYFRRQSVSPNSQDVLSGFTHQDYGSRWQQPGDEKFTNVPSFVYPANDNRSTFYRFSQTLVDRGDHVRLQDIRLAYDFSGGIKNRGAIKSAQAYVYASNLGILWRANKHGIDPDIAPLVPSTEHNLPRAFSVAMGLKFNF